MNRQWARGFLLSMEELGREIRKGRYRKVIPRGKRSSSHQLENMRAPCSTSLALDKRPMGGLLFRLPLVFTQTLLFHWHGTRKLPDNPSINSSMSWPTKDFMGQLRGRRSEGRHSVHQEIF